ncbi:protein-arginine deiminase type-2 isoform 2-T2 [Symphorus nematophorus]
MIHPRTLSVDYDRTINVVCVVGSELNVNLNRSAPPSSKFFSVKCTPNVQYSISPPPQETSHLSPIPLNGNAKLLISMTRASDHENDNKLSVWYYGENRQVLAKALMHLTAVEISLDVDADRDGVVEKNNPNKGSWKWGPNGHGAVLLVNCDSERTYWKKPDHEERFVSKVSDLKDMSLMVLRTKGPAKLPEGYKLTMHMSQGDADRVRVFRSRSEKLSKTLPSRFYEYFVKDYPPVLSSEVLTKEVPYIGGKGEMRFYVEGLRFPDKDFDGLISINLSLLEPIDSSVPETPIFTDKVVYRVAPWIMTPNTLQPVEVFVCSTDDNYKFLKGMTTLVGKAGHKLKVCHENVNRGDRWMQDELEFGYIDSPHHRFPVVLDSPRDGELVDFPYNELLGFRLLLASPDAGYKLFRGLQSAGHGQAKLFEGLRDEETVTVDEILESKLLQAHNNYVQHCIDWNRDVLKRELGLDDEDIIDLPILFKLVREEGRKDELRAVAYYPDMVNMIVLGKDLGIPKPFGPKVNGRCALEAEMCSLMEGLGLNCSFIDDFASYHKLLGEVHCGSNVRREPFDFKWWNLEM